MTHPPPSLESDEQTASARLVPGACPRKKAAQVPLPGAPCELRGSVTGSPAPGFSHAQTLGRTSLPFSQPNIL